MKDFVMRHPIGFGYLIFVIFLSFGIVLGKIYSVWFYLLFIPAILGLFGWLIFDQKWKWACPSCGREAFMERGKYCSRCGSALEIRRKIRIFRICPNGHKIEDNYNICYNLFCPKCGAPLPLKGSK